MLARAAQFFRSAYAILAVVMASNSREVPPAHPAPRRGLTLVEVVLIVAILGLVTTAALLIMNPAKRAAQTRNVQREASVRRIADAVEQYRKDTAQTPPASITNQATEICASTAAQCTSLVDLSVLTDQEKYLSALPKDPQCATRCATNGTGFQIYRTAQGFTVIAPAAELGATITASR